MLGEMLVAEGKLGARDLERALSAQAEMGGMLGSVLIRLGVVSDLDVARALSRQLNVPLVLADAFPAELPLPEGISTDFLKDKPRFSEKVDEFLRFIGDSQLVIHNAAFDMKFINAELRKVNKEEIPMSRSIDTVIMARKKFPGSPANLDALCKRFNIDLSARTKHGALLDAELLSDVYLELTGGRQAKLSLKAESELVVEAGMVKRTEVLEARVFAASPEELAAHENFLKKIKDAIWNKFKTAA